jgi:hypothetical protein
MAKRLFTECIEILNAKTLSIPDSDRLTEVFKSLYPITEWGKIDWDRIINKIEIGDDQERIIPLLETMLHHPAPKFVYVMWSDGSLPLITTNLEKIVQHYDDVVCVGFETFIFDPQEGWIIEILNDGTITAGMRKY